MDFCRLFGVFIIQDLIFGFGHWTLSDRLFLLWFEGVKKLKITFVDYIRAFLCKKYWTVEIHFFIFFLIIKYFAQKKFMCVSGIGFLLHPLGKRILIHYELSDKPETKGLFSSISSPGNENFTQNSTEMSHPLYGINKPSYLWTMLSLTPWITERLYSPKIPETSLLLRGCSNIP